MIRNRKIYSGFVIFAFFIAASFPLFSFAADIYESRLDNGLKNTEPYSYILMKKAQADPANAKSLLAEAIKYSPNLPAAYFEMARISFSHLPDGMFEGFSYVIEGVQAYKRNFWWQMSVAGLLFVSLTMAFVFTLLMVIVIRFFIDTPLLSHEIKEDNRKILIVLSLIPLSLLGPLFFITGTLFLLGLYFSKTGKVIVYISILFLLLSPFMMRLADVFLSASTPELRAVVAVNESRDNKYAISALKDKNDFASLFSYGLALKRDGHYEKAIASYKNILTTAPDPRIYVNLGNCYFAINDIPAAKDFYKKAADTKALASAYYNLSQASRETLDFVKGDEYFQEAVKFGGDAISKFAATVKRDPNRFVIDETLPVSVLWNYAGSRARQTMKISLLNSVISVLLSVVLFIAFFMVDSRMKSRAYRCKRCGTVLCEKCAKELLWGQMCPQCYKSIVKMDQLDSRERVAKLLQVRELQTRRTRMAGVLAFAPPGIAYIYAGRILAGSLLLWLFLFLLTLVLLNPLFYTGLSSFGHSWLNIPSIILLGFLYLISNVAVRRRLNRGWL